MSKILSIIGKVIVNVVGYIPVKIYTKVLTTTTSIYIIKRAMKFTLGISNADIEHEIYIKTCNIASELLSEGKFVSCKRMRDIADKVMNERFYGISME